MNKPKLNQPDKETTTTVGIFTDNLKQSKDIIVDKKTGFAIYQKQSYQPTIEEVKKEWEDDGWEWKDEKDNNKIYIRKFKGQYEDYGIYDTINIYYDEKKYLSTAYLNFKLHIRLTKTFRALGWEV